MNTRSAQGGLLYLAGKAEEWFGRLTFNRHRQASGFAKRIRGEAMMALARVSIKLGNRTRRSR